MTTLHRILTSPPGRKLLMAITGFLGTIFLAGHIIGNLMIFGGPDAMNAYAHALQSHRELLWLIRSGLLFILFLHIYMGVFLYIENRKARSVGYYKWKAKGSILAARTMIFSGIVITLFIIYHILHYTTGNVQSEYFNKVDWEGRHDVFSMVVMNFRNPWIAIIYIAAVSVIALHLRHAIQSIFQTLGWSDDAAKKVWNRLSIVTALFVWAGFIAVPFSIVTNVIENFW